MSALDFLAPIAADADVLARSPMEALAVDAGARLEARDGWNVAVSYPAASFGESVSWCDTLASLEAAAAGLSLTGRCRSGRRSGATAPGGAG